MSSQPTGFYMNAPPTGQALQSEKRPNAAFADSARQHTEPPRTPSRSNRSRTLAVTFRLSEGCPHSEPLDLHFSIALPSSPNCLHPEAFGESCQPAASPTKSIAAPVSSPAILRQRPASATRSMAVNCGTTSREARPGRSGIMARDLPSSPSPPPSSSRAGGPSHGLQPIVPLPSDASRANSDSRSMRRSRSRGPSILLAVPAVSMDKGVTRGVSWKSTELLSVAEEAVGTKASSALRVASHPRSGPSTHHGGKGVAPKDAIHGSRDEDAASVTEDSSEEDDNSSKTPHPRTSIVVRSFQGYRTDLRRASHEKNQNDDDTSVTENSSDEDDSQFKPAAQPRTFIAERGFQGRRSEALPLKREQDDDAASVTENSSDEDVEVMLQRPKTTAKRKLQTNRPEINEMSASGRKRLRTSD
ncbi:hypothetical protein CC1G_12825 [Coprinopsis cinerea okayama7|uniref:Uncharacterized protein n=1 Tax=Coprinopsis cinerea (strain Okayama-7 / 130 / ATCC MYA-4618 / FGSC 9003) TaxID=240176 RepID=A8PD81_COPC7|nr:hypothetical protein CC1G_12825 [Coprinopsis cinerea okayama7\|eukprot:XP_001840552.2 hypothetical protein CC1G_12825 [Coprinopsis cinerea okayama7\